MSDILSAISLFLAVLGLLYSTWYSEINSAINLSIPKYKEDRLPVLKKARAAFINKSLPLSISATLIGIIILPDFIRIVLEAYDIYNQNCIISFKYYDSVKMLFVGIFVLLIAFTTHLLSTSIKLKRIIKKCQE